jgi:hypothetical protein
MGDDNGGSSAVSIVAIIAILILVLVAGYFVIGKMRGGPSVPSKVDVNVSK